MKYQKQPLSIVEQINKLEGRGLIFKDKNLAAEYVAHFTVFNALEDVKGETSTQKILRDGKLYILRGKRMYDAMGRELKMGN